MASNIKLFGVSTDTTPIPTTYYGQTGWFTLPGGWATKQSPTSGAELIASPVGDFVTPPIYRCVLKEDNQTYVFQDLWLSILTGTANNNNGYANGR